MKSAVRVKNRAIGVEEGSTAEGGPIIPRLITALDILGLDVTTSGAIFDRTMEPPRRKGNWSARPLLEAEKIERSYPQTLSPKHKSKDVAN
jgi:hypothetical protein